MVVWCSPFCPMITCYYYFHYFLYPSNVALMKLKGCSCPSYLSKQGCPCFANDIFITKLNLINFLVLVTFFCLPLIESTWFQR